MHNDSSLIMVRGAENYSTVAYGSATVGHFLNISRCVSPDVELIPSFFGVMLALPVWESIITAITLSIVIVLTIVGNVLVILSVFTSKALRIVQNFYIVSLAVADLTVALFVLPFSLIYLIFGRWEFGIHLCKVWLTCDVMCCTSSILNLCVIALDRYWAVTDPVNNAPKRQMSRVLALIFGIWILSFLISSPPLFGWNDWPAEFTNASPCQLTSDRGYVIYSSLGSFFIPLLVMTVLYLKIYAAMRRRLRERILMPTLPPTCFSESASEQREMNMRSFIVCCRRRSTQSIDSLGAEADEMKEIRGRAEVGPIEVEKNKGAERKQSTVERSFSDVQKFIEQKQKAILTKERRAARTLGIIMGVFVICWLPFFLMYIVLPFCDSCCPSNRFKYFITWLGYINSGLNPVIYTIFNMDYRKAFKRLLGL